MKKLFTIVSVICILILCSGCGSEGKDNAILPSTDKTYNELVDSDSKVDLSDNIIATERKIIQTITMRLETKNFDSLLEGIDNQVKELGGYTESSSVSGNSKEGSNRRASITLRIPVDSSETLTDYINENCTILSNQINAEDATLKYIDTESRVSALETEKEALERILAEAKTVNDIISVQTRLTDVIYELESYEAQLRNLDNKISYSTITLYVNEVERISVSKTENVWQEIGSNLKNNTQDVWNFVVDMFVFFVSALPYFVLLGVVGGVNALIVIMIIKLVKRKKNKQ